MNPNTPVKVGDRVVVREARYGAGAIHVGRTGTVAHVSMRPTFGYYVFEPSWRTEYIVQMDAPRPEQVTAIRVEKVAATDDIKVGDQVIIREGYSQGLLSSVVGRTGEVTRIERSQSAGRTLYVVKTAENGTDRARRVEKLTVPTNLPPATAAAGDDVVILRTKGNAQDVHLGRTGRVTRISEPYTVGGETFGRTYHVDVPANGPVPSSIVAASKVVKASEQAPAKSQADAGQAEPASTDVGVLIDAKRVQAAHAAHTILGDEASLDDLIGLAEFFLAA